MTKVKGVAPSQTIATMITTGEIGAKSPFADGQIQPASLDLRLGSKAWRIRASFLPGQKSKVADRLSDFAMHEIDMDNGGKGAVFETGCVYLVELQEKLALHDYMSAIANAKSSTGRLDVFVRLITDNGTEFDRIDAGYSGPLYAEISPRTFSVLAREGSRLNQIRFRCGNLILDDAALMHLQDTEHLVDGKAHIDDGLSFSVDLKAEKPDGIVGYRAKLHSGLIDFDQVGALDPSEFWDPVYCRKEGGIILDPGAFYILRSLESVHIPPRFAAEMAPYVAVVGEFRVHYAGFFDPGFGHAAAGGKGSRGVLEVRCHESPFALEHGQIVGRLVFEHMIEEPAALYGSALGSNYQAQGLKLSKHFKNWP